MTSAAIPPHEVAPDPRDRNRCVVCGRGIRRITTGMWAGMYRHTN